MTARLKRKTISSNICNKALLYSTIPLTTDWDLFLATEFRLLGVPGRCSCRMIAYMSEDTPRSTVSWYRAVLYVF